MILESLNIFLCLWNLEHIMRQVGIERGKKNTRMFLFFTTHHAQQFEQSITIRRVCLMTTPVYEQTVPFFLSHEMVLQLEHKNIFNLWYKNDEWDLIAYSHFRATVTGRFDLDRVSTNRHPEFLIVHNKIYLFFFSSSKIIKSL